MGFGVWSRGIGMKCPLPPVSLHPLKGMASVSGPIDELPTDDVAGVVQAFA
jgi:hypothetical protein